MGALGSTLEELHEASTNTRAAPTTQTKTVDLMLRSSRPSRYRSVERILTKAKLIALAEMRPAAF